MSPVVILPYSIKPTVRILSISVLRATVCIGTTNPNAADKLEVAGNTSSTQFCLGGSCIALWPSGAVTSVSNSDGGLTISPTSGAVVASLALGTANTWTVTQNFAALTATGITNSAVKSASALNNSSGVEGSYGGATNPAPRTRRRPRSRRWECSAVARRPSLPATRPSR